MQVRCVRAFGRSVPGDLAEVPDGAAVDPEHWEPVTGGSDDGGSDEDPPPGDPAPASPVPSFPSFPGGM